MADIFFEDLEPGEVTTYGRHLVDRDEMVAFARDWDAQPFHLNEESARATHVGRLIASGWYSAALAMRMLCDAWLLRSSVLAGAGVERLRWLEPVVAGDVLSVRQTILDRHPSPSRPGTGLVRLQAELFRADGSPVMDAVHRIALRTRTGPAPRPLPKPEPAGIPAVRAEPEDLPAAARFFDDVVPGRAIDLDPVTFTPDLITGFARRFDPQPFHLDPAAAEAGFFGGLAASGWQSAAGWMRGFANRLERLAETGGRPQIGVSPGFRDLRWLRPVYAGDTIRYSCEPVEKRPLASRPGWGVVTSRNAGWNGRGEPVLTFTGSAFWRMRGDAGR